MFDDNKPFHQYIDDLMDGLEFPSDEEVKRETKNAKISLANKGRTHGENHRRKSARPGNLNGMYGVRLTGEKNPFYGKTHDEETRTKLSLKATSREKTYHCEYCNDIFTAQAYDQHHGQYCSKNPNRIVKSRKKKGLDGPQDRLICLHCQYEGGEGNMKRYHMDACEFNGYNIASYTKDIQVKVYTALSQFENDGINWHKVRACILGKSTKAYGFEWRKIPK